MMPSTRRTVLFVATNVMGLAAFAWPFVLPGALRRGAPHGFDAPILFLVLVACLGLLAFMEMTRGGLGPKAVALLGVLGALMVALRLPGFIAGASAMFIVVLVAGNAFGPAFGFLLGALGTLASSLFVGGVGPWVPFQMLAVGWVGLGAGLVPRIGNWPVRIGALAAYGCVAGFVFGAVMNLWFWPFQAGTSTLGWAPGAGAAENLGRYLDFYVVTSLWWDAFRAVGNVALVVLLGRPLLGALDRAATRMHLVIDPAPRPGEPVNLMAEPAGRSRVESTSRSEESPDSTGQDAGENPSRGDPGPVPQKETAALTSAVRVQR